VNLRSIPGAMFGFIAGLPLAFFLVFAGVFSDVFSLADRLVSLALTGGGYAAAGAIAGYMSRRLNLALWLAMPAVIILVWYTTREPQAFVLHLLYGVVAVSASLAGSTLGSRTTAGK